MLVSNNSTSTKDSVAQPPAAPPQHPNRPLVAQLLIDDDTFVVPLALVTPQFVLKPLTGAFNEADHEAWTSSIQHIRSPNSTPGFPLSEHDDWPPVAGMPLASNLKDLQQHHDDFKTRHGFTYTVLLLDESSTVLVEQDDDDSKATEKIAGAIAAVLVIGCVYMYPDPKGDFDVEVKSWVRASHSHLDQDLREAVGTWLRNDWPCFSSIKYEGCCGADVIA